MERTDLQKFSPAAKARFLQHLLTYPSCEMTIKPERSCSSSSDHGSTLTSQKYELGTLWTAPILKTDSQVNRCIRLTLPLARSIIGSPDRPTDLH